ncbi:MAG: N-formyl-4-amino-5-aminomethyl-2-methylpyrimidine deformylase [Promethearchaeota archaeon]|nr:MAG: N-formyl-4-amino-5-aminomethyl-2-methylpyrimidine deformylase [Candidatus Lokiarchaeota archaeon]
MSEEIILQYIEKKRDEFIEYFREMVKTDSYNPPGNELNLANTISQYLKEHNIDVQIFEYDENRANLIAFLNDNFKQKNLLFNGHMDIVPAGTESDWKYPPLSAYNKRNKYIYGRGAADMKGGLTAMVISLQILKELDLEIEGNLILTAVSDEETGGKKGTKWVLENKLADIKCDFAIVGEPTGLSPLPKAIVLGERGHLQLKIIAHGISCHASMPSMGKNAILMVNELLHKLDQIDSKIPEIEPPISFVELKDLIAEAFPSKDIFENIYQQQELLQHLVESLTKFTKSVTMIGGGIKENVVPDRCEMVIDFRLLPKQDPNQILNALKGLIKDLGYEFKEPEEEKADAYFTFEIIHKSEGSYWENWKDSDTLKQFYDIVGKIYERDSFYILYPACADAHYLRNNGFCSDTILFGPGSASTAHSVDEYIEIEDFINAIKTYTLFAYNFLKPQQNQ